MQLIKALALALGGGLVASTSLVGASKGTHVRLHRRATDVTPTAPGPGDTFKTGSDCSMQWTSGTGSKWSNMTIDLMTGANQNMTKLTTVVSNLDGTDSSVTSYNWTCPQVDPYSAIYFYQFTDSDGANPAWTTRFGIADADGNLTDPPESKQPTGEAIPWGTGTLISTSSSGTGSSDSSSSAASSDSTSTAEQKSSSVSSTAATSSRTSSPSSSTKATQSSTSSSSSSSSSASGPASVALSAASSLLLSSILLGHFISALI